MKPALSIEAEPACDRGALIEVWLASWTAAYPQIDFAARRSWFEEHLSLLHQQGSTTLTARDGDGGLAGFAIVDPVSGWLDQFVVRPDLFGGGVAGALMEGAKQVSPGCLQLDVNADNARARGFYRRQGFVDTGEGVNPNSGAKTISMAWRRNRGAALLDRPGESGDVPPIKDRL